MKTNDIRRSFIDFFSKRGHDFVRSAPIFPKDDPSLLFTNAGMNQFKNIFLGIGNERKLTRAVNSQKCMRVSGKHNDLEEVGRDGTHHTFFEMLGNWSFGDYYKKEAIAWAWELLTGVWKLDRARLFATVHTDDAEAGELWKTDTDIDPSHILKSAENFWEMGETGPCGPCSEIHFERSPSCGPSCGPDCKCGRFIEVWNLVFIQYDRQADGALKPLAARHVDTGMGLERITAIIQNKDSNYDTDAFSPLIARIAELAHRAYTPDEAGMPFRVIADHLRALVFSITDGVLPGNEGRGYVLRRLLRRAYRYGKKIGFTGPFLHQLAPELTRMMGGAYPELMERGDFVRKILEAEEKSFEKTLDKGLSLFETAASQARASGENAIDGATVFKLYDTYGFPADLTARLAEETGLSLDRAGFDKEMAAQRERARSASKFRDMKGAEGSWIEVTPGPSSAFTGYTALTAEAVIRKIRKTGEGYDFILDTTPFYAEQGGQAGDAGILDAGDRGLIEITDTRHEGTDIVHAGRTESDLSGLETVTARVDEERRRSIRRNHTATHIMQHALRKVLGDHAKQSGSSVTADRFRFDFTHFSGLTEDEILETERLCNEMVLQNQPVSVSITSIKEAEARGAMALFGEKYGETVRLVDIGGQSLELCGGTHALSTGEIGYIHILSESSVASGIRRVEAVTGRRFGEDYRAEQRSVRAMARLFKTSFDKVPAQVEALTDRVKNLEKEISKCRISAIKAGLKEIKDKKVTIDGISFMRAFFDDTTREALENAAQELVASVPASGVALFGISEDKGIIITAVSGDLLPTKKVNAGALVKALSEAAGGKGGGRPALAQGGAKDPIQLKAAFERAEEILRGQLAR